jgi:hypothetical protein
MSDNAPKPIRQLRLNTVKNTRRTLARLVRDFYGDPEASIARFRVLCYSIRTMGELFRAESELEVLARLAAIEAKLGGQNANG